MKTNIFVDCSYLIYFLIFGAYSAWKKKTGLEDDPTRDLSVDKDFIRLFEQKLASKLADITNIIKQNTQNDSELLPIVFVKDCSHKNNWRITKFPSYKIRRRMETKKPFDVGKAFGYVVNFILESQEIVNTYNIISVKSKRAEGDDVIATLVKYSNADRNIIIASDYDFLQLQSDKTKVINLFGETMSFNKFCDSDDITNAKQFLLLKILFGDSSDCIPHVFKGGGKKTCIKLMKTPEKLQEQLKNDEAAQKQFKINQELIDMSKIPKEIENEILNDYVIAIEKFKAVIV
jgi:5'-3' exonuclease